MVLPPSTARIVPVIKLAESAARKAIASATSLGCPIRPSACVVSLCFTKAAYRVGLIPSRFWKSVAITAEKKSPKFEIVQKSKLQPLSPLPGFTELTRTFFGASSRAITFVNWSKAAFDMQYAKELGNGFNPVMLETFTMFPLLLIR